ncbi:MAG: hypothetical protein IPI08_07870 [Betaproteobacteria bacterium]|nr:hypothetical protein [Betaproteobacteria bacterium]
MLYKVMALLVGGTSAPAAMYLVLWAWIGAPAALPLLRRTGYLRACAERATVARHGFDWLLPQSAVHWQHVNAALPLGRVGA